MTCRVPTWPQVRRHAQRQAVAAFDEVAAGSRRGATDVVLPVEARQDVPRPHEAGIFQTAGDAISIRGRIRKTVLRLDEIQRQAVGRGDGRAVAAAQLVVAADIGARTIEAQTAIVGATRELVGHVLDMRHARFGHDHHLRGLENVGQRLGGRELHLVGVVQVPALHFLVETEAAELTAMRESRRRRNTLRAGGRQRRAAQRRQALLERSQRREQQFDVVELQRHVLAIGHFALQRDAAPLQLGVERQADELDVLGILGEVAGGQRVFVGGDVGRLRGHITTRQMGVGADGGVLRGGGEIQVAAGGGRTRHAELRGGGDRRRDRQTGGDGLRRSAHRVERAEGIADALLACRSGRRSAAGGCGSSGRTGRTRCRCSGRARST